MKSYLSLIPISAKVHRRQNCMTLLCIIFAVFLVTVVFSMADMGVRMEKTTLLNKHGNWHIQLKNISESVTEQIGSRTDIAAMSWYDVINYNREDDYYIGDRKAVLYGVDEMYITDIRNCLAEGSYPQSDTEIMLSPNAKTVLGINIGDSVTINTPSGSMNYTVSGFGEDDVGSNSRYDTISTYMNQTAFYKICAMNDRELAPVYYVQFHENTEISKQIAGIKEQYGLTDENIDENAATLGSSGFSGNTTVQALYSAAVVLFVLILIAGVLMISSSINSNVAQRTKFFGMMRCIGMSRQQIIRFVRLEALNWCKTAVPVGVILGIVITWGLCAAIRFLVGGEFSDMPLFEVSPIGIISGVIVGIVTVLISARSPAKRAAKVSPVTAVSGNSESTKNMHHGVNTRFSKIETALGIHHAVSAKKNLLLMTSSFALSIILFLSFSVLIDLVGYLMPQPSNAFDISISSNDSSNSIDSELLDKISSMEGVKCVFGRRNCFDIPAEVNKDNQLSNTIDIISYDEYDLDCLTKDKELRKGSNISKVYGDSNYVLTTWDKDSPLEIGDKIRVDNEELEIAGMLKFDPFSSDGSMNGKITLITSRETFTRITGVTDYSLIMIQTTRDATDENVEAIRNAVGEEYTFSDQRDYQTTSTYIAFMLFVYGFLAIITLVTVLNIVNSISMSVSAKIKQYGAMRAVGMDERQITKMIAAEAFTYALSGCVVGCAVGLLISKLLYDNIITTHWNYATWSLPVIPIMIILLFVFVAAITAVYAPSKRIRNISVTETINEL
ncbi:FtsX-like permease family protein [Clostridium subterminale]|uniref:FtsX-like permease family protein n=1 Tax=Clostridium subterminale TaxID=1550 RepID=A0ABP3VUE9_CLOSU